MENFSEILQQEGRIIWELREQYKCDQHDACFVDDGRHIKLTAMHLQCWAREIVIFFTLYDQLLDKILINFIYFRFEEQQIIHKLLIYLFFHNLIVLKHLHLQLHLQLQCL